MECNGRNRAAINPIRIADVFRDGGRRYYVPLYQREYAWGEIEITKMMSDLWEAFRMAPERNYYLGTLVTCVVDGHVQVIDGQQRLTTLSLLVRLMGKCLQTPIVSFANRETVEEFLSLYCKGDVSTALDYAAKESRQKKLSSFCAAIETLQTFRPSLPDGTLHLKSIQDEDGLLAEKSECAKSSDMTFGEYILNKVAMFEVEMPDDTDVMAYFEVMNNRGEQLEFHEILKAKLLWKLYKQYENDPESYRRLSLMFNRFWTACSKMDGHLVDHLHICLSLRDNPGLSWTDCDDEAKTDGLDESGVPHERQSVIRDFSNFLMHVLRLYVEKHCNAKVDKQTSVPSVTLDERNMEAAFDEFESQIDPVPFLQELLLARLAFDKYVVKTKLVNDVVVEWRLKEIVKSSNKFVARCTYGHGNDVSDDDDLQKKMICLQSALQVSNASQRYKEWVYLILSSSESDRQDGNALLQRLERFAAARLAKSMHGNTEYFKQGLQTPRLALNITDYLMWKRSEENIAKHEENPFEVPRRFVFRYCNSVEHHHPQKNDTTDNASEWIPWINDIGNLYLISSSENSSMGKQNPFGKVKMYENAHKELPLSPKRNWMYKRTKEKQDWKIGDSEHLSLYVQDLLTKFVTGSNDESGDVAVQEEEK